LVKLSDERRGAACVKYRIALWSAAGFLVAGGWALYFASVSKDNQVDPIVYTVARLTCPVAMAGSHFPLSFYWVFLANAATYALVGLIVETLRRQVSHSK
jgi:hypothetical protein